MFPINDISEAWFNEIEYGTKGNNYKESYVTSFKITK